MTAGSLPRLPYVPKVGGAFTGNVQAPAAVGSSDVVIKSQLDAATTPSFGLSGNPGTPYSAIVDGRLYPFNFSAPGSSVKHTLVALREYYMLVWYPTGINPTELSVYVDTVAAGAGGAMALYAVGANMAIGAQIVRAAFDPTVTGRKTTTFAAPGAASWFWFGVSSDGAPLLRGGTPSFAAFGNGVSANDGIGQIGFIRVGIALASSLPATAPTTSLSLLAAAQPLTACALKA